MIRIARISRVLNWFVRSFNCNSTVSWIGREWIVSFVLKRCVINLVWFEFWENFSKMQRLSLFNTCSKFYRFGGMLNPKRCLATVKDVFPNKIDFPTRHIGPRKTEVVAMLDLLGYKVHNYLWLIYLFLFLTFLCLVAGWTNRQSSARKNSIKEGISYWRSFK